MKQRLLIYGAGGLGREVLSFVAGSDPWEVVGFIDDGSSSESIKGIKVVGGMEVLNGMKEPVSVALAIGDPVLKATIRSRLTNPHISFPVLKHPSALLQDPESVKIGEGSILTAGVIITTDVTIGRFVLINLNTTIGHNTSVGDYTSMMPGANIAGNVRIGEQVLVGSGANIINNVSLGDNCKVGMGAAVIQNVPARVTVVGVPAKPL